MVFVPVQVPRAAPMVTRPSYKVASRSMEFRRWPETILSRPSIPRQIPLEIHHGETLTASSYQPQNLQGPYPAVKMSLYWIVYMTNEQCRLAALTKLIISVIIPIYYWDLVLY